MGARNGININNIPFEQRCPPPDPRRRQREKLTKTDRAVCAFCGIFLGFFLWAVGYLILFSLMMRGVARHTAPGVQPLDPVDLLPPFWWGGGVSMVFALFGACVGAERMMDCFALVLRAESKIADYSRHV